MRLNPSLRRALSLTLLAFGAHTPLAVAQELVLSIDPAASQVSFTLGATLHTVEGSLRVLGGELRVDTTTGAASGELRLDARSAETGNRGRDRDMHEKVLLSAAHPTIVFRPARLRGKLPAAGRGEAVLEGTVTIAGREAMLAVPLVLEPAGDGESTGWRVSSKFRVPYVEWGLRDPSKAFLRVDPHVDVTARAVLRRR